MKQNRSIYSTLRKREMTVSLSDRNYRFSGVAGFTLTELLILVAIFGICVFLFSLSTTAIIFIVSGVFAIRLGWLVFAFPTGGIVTMLVSLLFGIVIMIFGAWVIFLGVKG